MTCRELTGFLSEYLDGELPGEARATFERHLGVCRACRAYLASFAQAVRLGRSVCEPADDLVPPDVPDDLVRAIAAARRGTPPP
jgi:anti-sigma factor RsiW